VELEQLLVQLDTTQQQQQQLTSSSHNVTLHYYTASQKKHPRTLWQSGTDFNNSFSVAL